MKKTIFYSAFLSLALLSACDTSVEIVDNGVIVSVQNVKDGTPRLVRLLAESESIIRVSATAEKKFADPQSLIVVDREVDLNTTVEQHGDTVTISTAKLKANVLMSTGEVFFTEDRKSVV